jgi:hypothetical protein
MNFGGSTLLIYYVIVVPINLPGFASTPLALGVSVINKNWLGYPGNNKCLLVFNIQH